VSLQHDVFHISLLFSPLLLIIPVFCVNNNNTTYLNNQETHYEPVVLVLVC
jgi:hypothetical protein